VRRCEERRALPAFPRPGLQLQLLLQAAAGAVGRVTEGVEAAEHGGQHEERVQRGQQPGGGGVERGQQAGVTQHLNVLFISDKISLNLW